MEKRIKELGQGTRLGIASGNVIPSVAAAVKELLENSLDAAATSVDIRLMEFGTECIEVADNGHGVSEDDYQSLVLRSHTSKLHSFEDLSSVESFGFRGEALSALCNLSDSFRVHTRTASDKTGCSLVYDRQGALISKTSLQKQPGTTVSVYRLFNDLPVRREAMVKQSQKEFAKILRLVHAYGIVSSGIKITCSNSSHNKTVLAARTSGHANVMDNIKDIYGTATGKLIPLKMCVPDYEILQEYNLTSRDDSGPLETELRLEGLISDPVGPNSGRGTNSGSNDRQFIFIGVNGRKRPCENPKVAKLVAEVYREFSTKDSSPFYVMIIYLDRENIDVNVVPSKNQVLIHNEKLLLATVKATIRNTCASSAGAAPFDSLKVQKNRLTPVLLTRKLALESARCNQATFSAAGRRQESTENETTVGRLQTGLSHALDCRLFQHLQFGATQQPKLSANTFGTEPPKGAKLAFNQPSNNDEDEEHDVDELEGNYGKTREPETDDELINQDTPPNKTTLSDLTDLGISEIIQQESSFNRKNDRAKATPLFGSQIEEVSSIIHSPNPDKSRSIIFSQFSTQREAGAPVEVHIEQTDPFGSQPFNPFGLAEPSQIPGDTPKSTQTMESDTFALDFVAAATRKKPAVRHHPVFENIDIDMDQNEDNNGETPEMHFVNEELGLDRLGKSNFDTSIKLPSVTSSNFRLNDSLLNTSLSTSVVPGSKADQCLVSTLSSVSLPKGVSRTHAADSPFKVPRKRASEAAGPSSGTKHRATTSPKSSPASVNKQTYLTTVNISLSKIRESMCKQYEEREKKRSEPIPEAAGFQADITPSQNEEAEKELQRNIQKSDFKDMSIIGQFNNGFIVTRLQDDFFLIDQHASDERYNFEDLQRTYTVRPQQMIRPLPLELTPAEKSVLLQNEAIFMRSGFSFVTLPQQQGAEGRGSPVLNRVCLQAAPLLYDQVLGQEDIREMIHLLSETEGVNVRPSKVLQALASKACRKSVMIGKSLNVAEMTRIVQHMGFLREPWKCAHGRPTIRHLFSLSNFEHKK